jgi:hypothetical protein
MGGDAMITLTREEAQQVLDALNSCDETWVYDGECETIVDQYDHKLVDKALETLRARLAQPERKWQGLTDEERTFLAWESNNGSHCVAMTEAKLKEKNSD